MAELELVASGFQTVEAPTVDPQGNLYFSDVRGGGVYSWSLQAGSNWPYPGARAWGGTCLHRDGGVVVCARDLRHVRNGESRIIMTREDAQAAPCWSASTCRRRK